MWPGRTTPKKNPSGKDAPERTGECALLQAVNVTRAGVFMAWREGQDLLVPVSQQQAPMRNGQFYVVYVMQDPQGKMIGSTKLHRYLSEDATPLKPREKVDLMIVSETDMGYKAIINNSHLGLLFKNEVFKTFKPGDKTTGYIKSIREDRKINLALELHDRSAQDELADRIIQFLRDRGGESRLTDYSPPQAIYKQFGVSKGKYKKALGRLYKKRLIEVSQEKITLL
ncbi:S1 RNA-binding domain-containing protein [Pseudomonadota bacterium]